MSPINEENELLLSAERLRSVGLLVGYAEEINVVAAAVRPRTAGISPEKPWTRAGGRSKEAARVTIRPMDTTGDSDDEQ